MSHKFFNIDWDLVDKKSAESKEKLKLLIQNNEPTVYDNKTTNNIITDSTSFNTIKYNKPTTYFLPPPVINSTLTYQNVNKDPKLRNDVTIFFLKKTIKW